MIHTAIKDRAALRPDMVVDGVGDGHRDINGVRNAAGPERVCTPPDDLMLDAEDALDDAEDALDVDREVLPQLSSGLLLLWKSAKFAKGLVEDPWQFSVEWPELQRAGLSCNEGRWLIHRGLVRQAREVTSLTDERRKFVPYASLSLSQKTCLLLTEEGCRFARRIVESRGALAVYALGTPLPATEDRAPAAGVVGDNSEAGRDAWGVLKPKWDRDRRQLRLGGRIIKEFKVPAANQEVILAVFEEEHWPAKIDDPLPRSPEIDPQRRLHDTINSLNRNQRYPLVHFGADGLGRGVRWRLDETFPARECC
jgi:hypothetical protein